MFLLYIAFSKYGTLKLGRENERPEFDDLSWFAMLFSCGIGVGVYGHVGMGVGVAGTDGTGVAVAQWPRQTSRRYCACGGHGTGPVAPHCGSSATM